MESSRESVAYAEQQTAAAYGVPSFVVADATWSKNKGNTPEFSISGQNYFRETMPEKNRGDVRYTRNHPRYEADGLYSLS